MHAVSTTWRAALNYHQLRAAGFAPRRTRFRRISQRQKVSVSQPTNCALVQEELLILLGSSTLRAALQVV